MVWFLPGGVNGQGLANHYREMCLSSGSPHLSGVVGIWHRVAVIFGKPQLWLYLFSSVAVKSWLLFGNPERWCIYLSAWELVLINPRSELQAVWHSYRLLDTFKLAVWSVAALVVGTPAERQQGKPQPEGKEPLWLALSIKKYQRKWTVHFHFLNLVH